MKRDILNLNFLYAVNEKIPNRKILANHLVKLLQIEKEAVYRRLRGEVPFTFAEVATISENMEISLNSIIGIPEDGSHPFRLILTDFETAIDEDLVRMGSYIGFLEIVKRDPNSEVNETWNTLPMPLIYLFENITRFYTFKWALQYKNHSPVKKFKEIGISPEIKDMQNRYLKEFKQIRHANMIMDHSVFKNLVNDIQYFVSIHLITKEEQKEIKEELIKFIEYIEQLSVNGVHEDTGNNISFYISHVEVDTNYSCMETRDFGLSMIRTLTFNAITSTDASAFSHIKEWINSLKRLSTLISVSGEKDRLEYLNEQKEIINSL